MADESYSGSAIDADPKSAKHLKQDPTGKSGSKPETYKRKKQKARFTIDKPDIKYADITKDDPGREANHLRADLGGAVNTGDDNATSGNEKKRHRNHHREDENSNVHDRHIPQDEPIMRAKQSSADRLEEELAKHPGSLKDVDIDRIVDESTTGSNATYNRTLKEHQAEEAAKGGQRRGPGAKQPKQRTGKANEQHRYQAKNVDNIVDISGSKTVGIGEDAMISSAEKRRAMEDKNSPSTSNTSGGRDDPIEKQKDDKLAGAGEKRFKNKRNRNKNKNRGGEIVQDTDRSTSSNISGSVPGKDHKNDTSNIASGRGSSQEATKSGVAKPAARSQDNSQVLDRDINADNSGGGGGDVGLSNPNIPKDDLRGTATDTADFDSRVGEAKGKKNKKKATAGGGGGGNQASSISESKKGDSMVDTNASSSKSDKHAAAGRADDKARLKQSNVV